MINVLATAALNLQMALLLWQIGVADLLDMAACILLLKVIYIETTVLVFLSDWGKS